MNRPVKFRARTLDGSWIYTSPDVMFNFRGEFAYLPGRGEGATIVPLTKGTMGQLSGLKDKNGVEIYEGDIVRMRFYEGPDNWSFEHGQIIWHGKSAGFKWSSGDPSDLANYWLIHSDHAHREVIGNVYENPELLELRG